MADDNMSIPDVRPAAFWFVMLLLGLGTAVSLTVALYGVLR